MDNVNHPSHYSEGRNYEPIDVIDDWGLDFCLGNVVKYISRAGRKDDILQDLRKAEYYLHYKIKQLEEKIEPVAVAIHRMGVREGGEN